MKRRICFVTGTRAEFGLMRPVLDAIRRHRQLTLQLVVTGMHTQSRHGNTAKSIRAEGWKIDALVKWPAAPSLAKSTGAAIAALASQFARLKPDIVLIVGDRVEAFAAATAAHLAGIIVAHVHGGDRALGQVDDSLRHAITKLSHIHFPATRESARRIARLGENSWRIHHLGSPGIDGILKAARSFPGTTPKTFALLVLHPADADKKLEHRRAFAILRTLLANGPEQIVIIYPNNDPGSAGIIRAWDSAQKNPRCLIHRDIPRPHFLGLMRDAAFMIGNSSAGIIEAASFGTPVIDVGPRQKGRQRSANVHTVSYSPLALRRVITTLWNNGHPRRSTAPNVYAGPNTGTRIAAALARVRIDSRLRRKLISA